MPNPNGPYPGRQLFVGLTADGKPAVVYLVTGRSVSSRERRATRHENSIIIGPLGNVAYDPLRHYTAVKWDDTSGVIAVTNGVQTEAIFETYRLLFNTGSAPTADYLEKIMEGAGAEPDSLHTPRIAGVITSHQKAPIHFISIKRHDASAQVAQVKPLPGTLTGVSVYNGDMENPTPFSSFSSPPQLHFKGGDAKALAEYLFELSSATHMGDDIRVCAVGGIY
ncbi:MAG: IMP cyclohydrolase, partial [Dehalococcoidia bacterium]|nr:IMP cyclohydrolase [Dehalococcoidia bacterium]